MIDFDDGMTYGEACDKFTVAATLAIVNAEKEAVEYRAVGEVEGAKRLENEADELRQSVSRLIEKRQSMPFGNLSDEQRDTLREIYGPVIPE